MHEKGPRDPGWTWKKCCKEIVDIKKTIISLDDALEAARSSLAALFEEMEEALEEDRWGPAPSAPVRNFSTKLLPLNPQETLFPRPQGQK